MDKSKHHPAPGPTAATHQRRRARTQSAPPPSIAEELPPDTSQPTASATAPDGLAALNGEERRALIAEAAYYRAQQRGFEPGRELEDWLAAERDIERLVASTWKPFNGPST